MPKQVFMRVQEVAAELGVSVPYAYKLIRQLNEELKATGCITIAGRIDRKFFHEKLYGMRNGDEREKMNGGIQKQEEWNMVCTIPLYGLAWRASAEIETRFSDETGGAGMGAPVLNAEASRCEHDV